MGGDEQADMEHKQDHLFLEGQMHSAQLEAQVEEHMNHLEAQVEEGLQTAFRLVETFEPIAKSQKKSRECLRTFHERLKVIQPLLASLMEHRHYDHFLSYVGGLRALYLCLLELLVLFRRIIDLQMKKAQTLRQRLQSTLGSKEKKDSYPMEKSESKGGWKSLLSSSTYLAKQLGEEPTISGYFADVFKKQITPTLVVLKHIQEQMLLMMNLWSGERTEDDDVYRFNPFVPLHELYENHKDLEIAAISSHHHLGFTYVRSLVEYSMKLKAVYCAVHEAESWKDSLLVFNNAVFYPAAARYFLSPDQASKQYGVIRQTLDVFVQRQVWNLMEDPVIEFFATALGLNPRKLPLPIDHRVRFTSTVCALRMDGAQLTSTFPGVQDFRLTCSYLYAENVHVDASLRPARSSDQEDTPKPPGAVKRKDPPPSDEGNEEESVLLLDDDDNNDQQDDPSRYLVTPDEPLLPPVQHVEEYIPVVILHVHGGGWISQSPRTHLAYLRMWANQTRLPILSVDYGLSPENHFPHALNQCYAAYRWLLNPDNAKALGLTIPENKSPRIILTGDSAGGNLCAALTIRLITEKLPKPIGLLLTYPVVFVDSLGSISRLVYSQDPILNYQSLQIVLNSYLGEKNLDLGKTEPLVSPAIVSDEILAQFPQTFLMAGDVDPLLDDSTYFFRRLREVNVPTAIRIYRHLPHGYLNLPAQLPNAPRAIFDAGKIFLRIVENDDNLHGFCPSDF